jgi:peptide/nickel transport system substrate-binding protein
MAFVYSARLDPSLAFDMLAGPKDTQPRKVWDNPEVQAKLVESMQVPEKARRQALFDELHKRMLDDVPLIPLYNGLQITAANKKVQGLRTWAAEVPRLWNVKTR